jgi:peptidoglycan/LPS O-acetylase OafA/YrhL
MPPSNRFRSLDGLRGVAALIVVVYHVMLTGPAIANAYLHPGDATFTPVSYAFFWTPLHVLWAGREAVIVFFVLSGFVLALPAASGRPMHWLSYYPRRIVRLYLPSIASLLLAFVTTVVVVRHTVPGGSEWLNQHVTLPHGLREIALGATLLIDGSGGLNTPLWSLKWEVLFSLLLPAYLLAARYGARHWAAIGAAILAAQFIGTLTGLDGFTYLAEFAAGVLLAFNREALAAAAGGLTRGAWGGLTAAAVLLLTAHWAGSQLLDDPDAFYPVSIPLTTVGAALIVFVVAWCPTGRKMFEHPTIAWLGRVSFSLYLVHEPIVVATSFVVGPDFSPWLVMAFAVPMSLVIAEVFYRLVEAPSHRLSQRIGKALRPVEDRQADPASASPT